jgi:hypothetical protein
LERYRTLSPKSTNHREVDFLALATPVLAYAGLAITRSEMVTFRASGWKLVIVAFLVFTGTYLASAAIAQVMLCCRGRSSAA